MSEKLVLYYHILSPPSRAVLLTAAALGVDLELKTVNLLELEHKKPEFIKLNPQHTVPLLVDNGINIIDSHAICAYLSEKYGKNDQLYPRDLVKRSEVDARLHFDSGHLFGRIRFLYEPVLYFKETELPESKIEYIRKLWDIIERFLESTPYLCGNELTIADLCCVASVSSVNTIAVIDPIKYPKLLQWIDRLAQLPYYQEKNGIGAKALQEAVLDLLKQNKAAASQ